MGSEEPVALTRGHPPMIRSVAGRARKQARDLAYLASVLKKQPITDEVAESIGSSYQGLPPAERLLFRRLATPGITNVTAWAAAVLADDSEDHADEIIGDLVYANLLAPLGRDAVSAKPPVRPNHTWMMSPQLSGARGVRQRAFEGLPGDELLGLGAMFHLVASVVPGA
jgi:hypothetical protein